jgi:isoquinoline 1-oxidoreductase beta subunit
VRGPDLANVAIGRRGFLLSVGASAGGMCIGFSLYPPRTQAATGPWTQPFAANDVEVNAWLVIRPDDTVVIRVGQSEMGEGVFTALPMIIAEELECDWTKVRPEYASVNRSLREANLYGRMKTGGSSAVRLGRPALQQAGASARVRLVEAAARRWGVPASDCVASNGRVSHSASGRSINYGAIAREAAAIRLPEEPAIKAPDQFRLIGQPKARLDTPAKCDGSAVYGMDVRVPDMKYAAVKMCPVFGGKVASFDAGPVLQMKGVRSVHQIADGVAVVADNTWTAMQAVASLDVTWDEGANASASSEAYRRLLRASADSAPGVAARKEGDAARVLSQTAGQTVRQVYELPFLAHAAMEPLNCTAHVTPGRVDIWVGTQVPEDAVTLASDIAGVPREQVYLNNCFLGGGFGRRLLPDDIRQAVAIAKQVSHPVKVVWSRQDDIQHDRYRPQAAIGLHAALGPSGLPSAWSIRSAVGSIQRSTGADTIANGLDHLSLDGLEKMPYRVPNLLVECVLCDSFAPLGPWRSVNSSQNAFALESFVDELAVAAGEDPVDYRRRMLEGRADWLRVLDVAVEKSEWGKTLERGRAQGFAIFECYGSIVAEVAEVTISRQGVLTVDTIVAAIDCGHVVNPKIVESQVEGAIAFGLTAAIHGEITMERGRVKQSNFHNYKIARMSEMPRVEVHLALTGGTKWGGVGEPGLPPLAPAVGNAIWRAIGRRVRRLPFSSADLTWS